MIIEKLTLIISNSEEEEITNTYRFELENIFTRATNRINPFVYY